MIEDAVRTNVAIGQVAHDALDCEAVLGEEGQRGRHDGCSAFLGLVGQDGRVGQARGIPRLREGKL